MSRLYAWFGGRKQFNTYLGAALLVGYAAFDHPDFLAFAGGIGAVLGFGSFTVAYEDRKAK